MPIRPEMKHRYPANWSTEIRPRILARAGNKCEWCGVANGSIVPRGPLERRVRVVLTIAHVNDRAPENCADDNLAALCQKCHLNHDRPVNQETRLANELAHQDVPGQLKLFEESPQWPS